MPNPVSAMIEPHHEAEELLPWYVTGQLDAEEQALVDQHLSSCAHCRRQLAFERRMIDEFADLTPEVDSSWARLKERLEPQRQHEFQPRDSWSAKIARDAAAMWQSFNRPAFAMFAVAQLAFVIVAGSLLLSLSRPSYRALGSAPAPQSANVIVMFSPDMTESELSALLNANGAAMVGGPTSTDAYLLHVPQSSRPEVLAKLRSDRHVIMAQPVDGDRN